MADLDGNFDLSQDLPWDDYVRTYFRQFREVLRGNGQLCDLIVLRTGALTPEATRIATQRVELVLDVLVRAGFTPDTATYAYSALSVFARGALLLERSRAATGRPEPSVDEVLRNTPGLSVRTTLNQPHTLSMTSDGGYEFGLENSIRGLQMLLDRESGEPSVARARNATDAVPVV
jgi:hypothetical protein